MIALPALPVLPAAPARVAAPAEHAAAESGDNGGFKAALEQAREPAEVHRAAEARKGSQAAERAATRNRCADSRDQAAGDKARAAARAGDQGDDHKGDMVTEDADSASANLATLLPGWPATPAMATPTTASASVRAGGNADAPGGCRSLQTEAAVGLDNGVEARVRLAIGAVEPSRAGLAEATSGATGSHLPLPTAQMTVERPAPTASTAAQGFDVLAAVQALKAGAEAPPNPAAAPLGAIASNPPQSAAFGTQVSATAAPTFEARLAAAIDSPAFAPALANQVTWLAHGGVQQARLTLNPAEMGPLSVQIVVDGTQARIEFSAEVAGTRAAIEASLPTLAAALNESGLTLAGGGVSDGQARQGTADGRPLPQRERLQGNPQAGDDAARPAVAERGARGLVDLVA